MPWFFTHIRHGDELIEDQHGQEFETLKDAVDDAIAAARQIMADRVRSGQRSISSMIEVRDEAGLLVRAIRFVDVLDHD